MVLLNLVVIIVPKVLLMDTTLQAITHRVVTHLAVTHQAVTHQAVILRAVTHQTIIQLAIIHPAISHLLITHLKPYKVMITLFKIPTAKLKSKEFARGYHTEKFVRQSQKRLVQLNLLRNARKSAKIPGYATIVTQ